MSIFKKKEDSEYLIFDKDKVIEDIILKVELKCPDWHILRKSSSMDIPCDLIFIRSVIREIHTITNPNSSFNPFTRKEEQRLQIVVAVDVRNENELESFIDKESLLDKWVTLHLIVDSSKSVLRKLESYK